MINNFKSILNKLTRYGLIVILVCVILAPGVANAEEWSLKEAAKPYAGQTVNLVWFAVPWSSELAKVIPQFEKETGIKVNITDYPYESLHEKIATEITAGTGAFDLVLVDSYWMPEFSPYLTNLEKLQDEHPELVDPQFNWEDIDERVMKYGVKFPGFIGAFPGYVTNHMLMYRKDLFDNPKYKEEFKEKYGYDLTPPEIDTSLKEFKDICEFFTRDTDGDGKIDLYGYCSASARTAVDVIQEYGCWLEAEGGRFFEDWENGNFKPMFDTPQALAALKYHKDILRYQPPGVTSFGVYEQTLAFQNGEVAMVYDWTETIPDIENKEKSMVAGKVGYSAGMPQVGGQFGPMPVIMPNTSKHKEAAFLLGQWIHSRDIMVKTEIASSPRVSMLLDPQLQAKYPYYKAAYNINKNGFVFPLFPELVEWADKVQSTLSRCLTGEISPEKAVDILQKEVENLMKNAGYTW
jgi:multiple sugar transport system substrate-binding protein